MKSKVTFLSILHPSQCPGFGKVAVGLSTDIILWPTLWYTSSQPHTWASYLFQNIHWSSTLLHRPSRLLHLHLPLAYRWAVQRATPNFRGAATLRRPPPLWPSAAQAAAPSAAGTGEAPRRTRSSADSANGWASSPEKKSGHQQNGIPWYPSKDLTTNESNGIPIGIPNR